MREYTRYGERYRSEQIQAAIDLHYPKEVIERLINAKTEEQRNQIMRSAREKL